MKSQSISTLRLFVTLVFTISTSSVAFGQEQKRATKPQPANVPVTVSASGAVVRFTTVGAIERMRLEVFDASGVPVFDSGFKAGNLRDWRLRGTHDEQLPDSTYLCVVTIRELSGRMSFKQGTVLLQGGQARLALEGSVEPERVTPDETLPERNSEPSAMMVRAGMRFSDGMVETSAAKGASADAGAIPQVSGTGTTGKLTKWTNGAAGTLGDSVVTESATGNIGVGTAAPNNKLHVVGRLEIGAPAGSGVNPTIVNPNNVANFAQVQFYPASGTNVATSFLVVPKGTGVANTRAQFGVFRTDFIADPANFEFSALRARESDFVFGTGKAGTGLNRPLMFAAGFLTDNVTNNNQFYLATDGNVGVGTNAPAARLHVAGLSGIAAIPLVIIESSGNQIPIAFKNGTTERARIRSDAQGNLVFTTLNGTRKNFHFRAGSEDVTNLFIQSSTGNVGIGTTTPGTARLRVEGGNVFIAAPNSLVITSPNGSCWKIRVSNTGALTSASVTCPGDLEERTAK